MPTCLAKFSPDQIFEGTSLFFMTNLNAYWPEILDIVRQRVASQTFNTWFKPLQPVNSDNQVPAVDCPDRFFMDWFSEHHLTALNEAGSDYFGTETQFSLKVTQLGHRPLVPLMPESANKTAPAATIETKMNNGEAGRPQHQAPLAPRRNSISTNINPEYTFDNFVVGSSTDLVFAAATAVAKNPGGHFNPLFIYGGVGLGKTHLMHAIGNAILERDPTQKVCYVSTENFMNELVASIRDRKTPEFKAKYRSMDVLLVDDVAFLTGKESTQEEFFQDRKSVV